MPGSAITANKIINYIDFQDGGFNCEIPHKYIFSEGIISDIPLELTEEEILRNLECKYNIKEVNRMTYRNREKQVADMSTRIKITFRAYRILEDVKIYHVVKRVKLFVDRVGICKKCLQF